MAIDRSKFKGSNQQKVVEADQAADNLVGKSRGQFADQLQIEDGPNRFRVYPAHPDGGGEVYAEPVSRVFLPAMVPEKDQQGKEIIGRNGKPQLKKSMKPVFNSKLHAGTPKDLVEEYFKLGIAKGESFLDPKEKEKFIAKLNGQYNDNAQFRLPGIQYQQSWVMYADKLAVTGDKVVKFGRLEVKKGVKDKMNKVAAIESASDPLGIDPYSDAETGLPIKIIKNKQVPGGPKIKPNDIYEVVLEKDFDRIQKRLIEYPLTDEQLEKFLTFPSLHSIFAGTFKLKDFQLQLQGLEMFDQDYQIGIFNTDEFLAVAEEIAAYYDEEETPTTEEGTEGSEGGEEAEPEQTGDQFDLMTRLEMKNFIQKEKLGITIKQTMNDEVLRNLIREALATRPELKQEPLPGEPGHVDTKAATQTPPAAKPATTPTSGSSTASRLAGLRKTVNA